MMHHAAKAVALASYVIAIVLIALVLKFGLLPALIAGLLVYTLERSITPQIAKYFASDKAKLVALGLMGMVIVFLLSAVIFLLLYFIKSDGGISGLLLKMAEGISATRTSLPESIQEYLPNDIAELRQQLETILRENAGIVPTIGNHASHVIVYTFIGMIIGGLVALHQFAAPQKIGPLVFHLSQRAAALAMSFRKVIYAQIQISFINTCLTAVFIYVILPAFDVTLPLRSTIVIVTFVAGLLPIIGNIMSNTVTTIIGFHVSPMVALAALIYLVVIHKLEYFLNAKIIGHQVDAKAWELLTAMLLFEAIFGIAGLIAAPILYSWLKRELLDKKLI